MRELSLHLEDLKVVWFFNGFIPPTLDFHNVHVYATVIPYFKIYFFTIILVPECSLMPDFQRMLKEELHTDCELIVADTVLRAHKAVLSVRSPVFNAMFDHNMKEANSSQCIIEDLTVNSVRAILQFIYTDTCPQME